jgi:PKD repeat protein
MNLRYTKLTLAILLGLGTTACGGGGSSSNDSNVDVSSTEYSVSVSVQDGDAAYVSNAAVCLDLNSDSKCDSSDAGFKYTNSDGKATVQLTQDQYNLGKNIIAITPNGSVYSYKIDSEVSTQDVNTVLKSFYLNPVSTMVSVYAASENVTTSEAQKVIASTIGASANDLSNDYTINSSVLVFANALNQKSIKLTASSLVNYEGGVTKINLALTVTGPDAIIDHFLNNDNFDISIDDIKNNSTPVADFSYELSGCRTINLTATADDADGDSLKFTWNFGDDSDAVNQQNPTHVYRKNNDYQVFLQVSDGIAKTSVTKNVTIDSTLCTEETISQFSFSNDKTNNAKVIFSDESTGDVSTYMWDFGDGTSSSDANPVHEYKSSGTYYVTLTVKDSEGSTYTSEQKSVVISIEIPNNAPNASFTTIVTDLSLKLTNTSSDPDGDSLTYSWISSDGFTSTEKNFEHTFANAGSYTVTLSVFDGKSTSTKSTTVTLVAPNDLNATITTVSQEQLTVFLEASAMNASSNASYSWVMGDGSSPVTGKTVTYSYKSQGTYTVELTVTDGDNSVTKTLEVTVSKDNTKPTALFAASVSNSTVTFTNKSTDPDGDDLTYSWSFGDGKTSTEKSPTHTYDTDSSKSYDVVLTVSDGKVSAVYQTTVNIVIACTDCGNNTDPVADFHYKFQGLTGVLTAVATDEDGDNLSYTWDLGDGLTSTQQNPKVTYTSGGKKTVTLVVSDGKTSVSKSYQITLSDAEVVLPTKTGLYYKGSYSNVHIWINNTPLAGAWPGATMSAATENSGWMFYDTSSISQDKVSMIFSNAGSSQTGDLTNLSPTGCYVNNEMIALSDCNLSDSEVSTVEGGCDIPVIPPDVTINDIEWGNLDYSTYTSSSDVSVDSAPYVTTNLAPGSYHENKTVTLSTEDADRNKTSGTIYYTLDNTVPTEQSTKYTGTISLDDTSTDGLGTAYRLRTLVVGSNGMKQEQHFFWFIKKNGTVAASTDFRDETIYFVVTARFYDGDEENNYYCRDRFDSSDPSWRGDFKGLIEKLDYIKGMGFTAIWITPPVENRSGLDYHGYHAYDWFQPDLRLESKGATYFDFIKAAHDKGIKIVQDVVLNHSSNYGIRGQAYIEKIPTKYYIDPKYGKNGTSFGPYENNIGDYLSYGRCDNDNYVAPAWHRRVCAGDPAAAAEFNITFKDGTVNVNSTSTLSIDNRYFWSPAVANYLPEKWYHVGYTNNWESVDEVQQRSMAGDCVDLKTESQNVRDYMNAAMKMYIDMGIDAVRIDTLKHMPREDVTAMTDTWRSYKPNMFIFGESLIKGFGDNTPSQLLPWFYTRTGSGTEKTGDSGVSVLDFSLMSTFRDNVTKGSLGGLAEVFSRFDSDYADATKLVTFFQNHDLTPDNTWSGSGAQHCCTDRANSALAYNVLWTVRGIPVMYAGDETGVRVGLPPDLVSSNDFVKETGRIYMGDSIDNGDAIIGHITDLNAIRKTSKALQRGKLTVLASEPLVFERTYEDQHAIVAIVGTGGSSVVVSGASTDGTYTDVVTGTKYTVSGGSVSLGSIPGASMRVLVKDYAGGKVTGKSSFLK